MVVVVIHENRRPNDPLVLAMVARFSVSDI